MFIFKILGCVLRIVVAIVMFPVIFVLTWFTTFINLIWGFIKIIPLGLSFLLFLSGMFSTSGISDLILSLLFFAVAMIGELVIAAMMGLINLISRLAFGGSICQ